MSGILWASLGAAVGLLAPFLFHVWQRSESGAAGHRSRAPEPVTGRQKPSATKTPAGLNRRQTRKFHGVSVKPGPQCCQAVGAIVGQRFLPDEVPALPLASCDQAACRCAYSHHGDRRDREDRRTGWGTFGGFTPSIPGGNRRAVKGPDRRRS